MRRFKYVGDVKLIMILKEALREVVLSQKKLFNNQDIGVERNVIASIDTKLHHAFIISGIRRCGKSTLMLQLSKKIKSFNYLNFEDTRLTGFEAADFEKLDEIYKEEYGKQNFIYLMKYKIYQIGRFL